MSQRKQVRLLLLLAALIVTLVVTRLVLAATRDDHEPVWVGDTVDGVAEAATNEGSDHRFRSSAVQSIPYAKDRDAVPTMDVSPHSAPRSSSTREAPKPLAQTTLQNDDVDVNRVDDVVASVAPLEANRWCQLPDGGRLLNLNQATQQDLDALPGIGPVIAAAILAERTQRGGFSALDELLEVKGIGESRLARLAPLLCLPGESSSP